MRLLPKLISSYSELIEKNFVYVDKTKFIELIEKRGLKVPLFLRPGRFGKTLFTDLLAQYYDLNSRDNFEKLFSKTYIGINPTPQRNSFYILRMDFSGIDQKNLEENFFLSVKQSLVNFCLMYRNLNISIDENIHSSAALIGNFFSEFRAARLHSSDRIFMIIDEYDNFANGALDADTDKFTGINSVEGFIINFYVRLKAESNMPESAIERFFITGISSIMINSVISGFDYDNISQDPLFNEMAGFTENEVRDLIHQTMDLSIYSGSFTEDELIAKMKLLFDGYSFCKNAKEHLFNSSLTVNYLREVMNCGELINSYTDENVNLDIYKFSRLMEIINVQDRMRIIRAIAHVEEDNPCGYIYGSLEKNLNLNAEGTYTMSQGVAMLFYLGYLTYGLDEFGGLVFKVPNLCYRKMFMQYYLSAFFSKGVLAGDFGDLRYLEETGDISKLKHYLEQIISNIIPDNEKDVTERSIVSIVGTLILTNLRHCSTYVEYDIRKGGIKTGEQADLVIFNEHKNKPSFLIEFKYKRSTAQHRSETVKKNTAALVDSAKEQIDRYMEDDSLSTTAGLQKYVIVYAYGNLIFEKCD